MKKYLFFITFFSAFCAGIFAYNPPVGAEDFCLISSPAGLSGNLFTAGLPANAASAESITVNPALTAGKQRVNLNAGFTLLANPNANGNKTGAAFQAAILIPNKLYVFSGYVNGSFISFDDEICVGNSFNAKAGLSKEITEKLNVGASLNSGVAWKNKTDWALGFNCGFVYNYGSLGFLKDFRYAASVLNLGKNYDVFDSADNKTPFPSVGTLKLGVAASLLKTEIIDVGAALDFTIPAFQNFIVDMNLQFTLKQTLTLSVGEKINVAESANGYKNFLPSLGLFFKFSFDIKNSEYLAKRDWSQSEMKISAAYKNMYENVNAFSVGADVDLGMRDADPPQIILWNEE